MDFSFQMPINELQSFWDIAAPPLWSFGPTKLKKANAKSLVWLAPTSAWGLGCVKTRGRSIATEEVIRPRPL